MTDVGPHDGQSINEHRTLTASIMAEEKVALAKWNGSIEELPLPTMTSERTGWRLWQKLGVVGVLVTLALLAGSSCCSGGMNEAHLSKWLETAKKDKTDWVSCPHQPKALHPEIKWEVEESYRNHSAGLLSAAVVCIGIKLPA
jgi:hypothetical protein